MGSAAGSRFAVRQRPARPLADRAAGAALLSSYSRFAQRLRRRYAAELSLLPPGRPALPTMAAAYDALRERGDDAGTPCASCASWSWSA